jgi:signal transduction histidine kinase
LQPEHDWPAIAEEARHLVSEPAEVDLLTAPRQQLLVSWARQAALEEELSLRTDVYQLTMLNDSESLLRQSVAILRRTTTQPVAIWVSPNLAGLPMGLGAVSAWTQGSRYLPAAVSGGDRDAFERTLPGSLRSSREYRSETGEVAAIVYFDSRVTAWTLRWSETIMQVLQSHGQRARGPEVASALRSPQSVAAAMAHVERELLEAIAEFSAGAGHEINNPLGAILGQAQWLLQEEVDPKRRHCLQKIADQVGRIRRMIRDLRLIGRPTAPRPNQVPLAESLSQAVAAASKRIAGPSLCLEDRGLAVIVSGVAEEISRAIEELVVNAMEAAGPNGQVTVRQSLSGADVVIDVIDSGPGFTVESRRHAYTPFYSGRTAGRGLGMGLAVAKRIVSDFGGRLTIFRTRPTKVRISFPIAESCRNAA